MQEKKIVENIKHFKISFLLTALSIYIFSYYKWHFDCFFGKMKILKFQALYYENMLNSIGYEKNFLMIKVFILFFQKSI